MCQVRPSHRGLRSAITPPYVPEGCVDLHNTVVGDTCMPDCALRFIIATMETVRSMRYTDASFDGACGLAA
jgi:hypothetical protein